MPFKYENSEPILIIHISILKIKKTKSVMLNVRIGKVKNFYLLLNFIFFFGKKL